MKVYGEIKLGLEQAIEYNKGNIKARKTTAETPSSEKRTTTQRLAGKIIAETDRLLLREMTDNDYESLYTVLADSDIMTHYPYTFDEERVRGWIEKNIERYRIFGFGLWTVALKETGETIGDCGITMQNINGFVKPEIGYHINKNFQRRGFATEAAKACRDWAFENTPFKILYSYMKKPNIASSSVAKAIGMHKVEEFTDTEGEITEVYAISRKNSKLL